MTKAKRFIVKRIGQKSGVVHEYITKVDPEDAHYLRSSYWVVIVNQGHAYVCRRGPKGPEYLHRIVLGVPGDEPVFHINGDSLDNRKENLMRATERVVEVVE